MVVLDASIVNVALPHIQRALHFSGDGLEWVITAYALAFGGLLLLGGRAGDLLGRRKMFIIGIRCSRQPLWPGGSPPRRPGCWPPARSRVPARRSRRRLRWRWSPRPSLKGRHGTGRWASTPP
jgi:hypothetical protein